MESSKRNYMGWSKVAQKKCHNRKNIPPGPLGNSEEFTLTEKLTYEDNYTFFFLMLVNLLSSYLPKIYYI